MQDVLSHALFTLDFPLVPQYALLSIAVVRKGQQCDTKTGTNNSYLLVLATAPNLVSVFTTTVTRLHRQDRKLRSHSPYATYCIRQQTMN